MPSQSRMSGNEHCASLHTASQTEHHQNIEKSPNIFSFVANNSMQLGFLSCSSFQVHFSTQPVTATASEPVKMAATRITVALNAKQSSKTPLLIPASASADPAAASSIRALVFKAAQSKLRLKKPTRIYAGRSGQELLTEDDWKTNLKDDLVLLISGSEEYVGAKKESGVHG
jgi:hypothetical protein